MRNNETIFNESLNTILDCMGGADGGISFILFKSSMNDIAKELDRMESVGKPVPEGFTKALNAVTRVAKLIDHFDQCKESSKE